MNNPVSAKTILSELWDGTIPVDIEAIVRSLSINIIRGDILVGGYADTDNNQRIIGINGNLKPMQQRFYLAHELGHHALMHPLPRDKDVTITHDIDYFEIEADRFALEMLIPDSSLSSQITNFKVNGSILIQPLADLYGVSYDEMYLKLKTLGHG